MWLWMRDCSFAQLAFEYLASVTALFSCCMAGTLSLLPSRPTFCVRHWTITSFVGWYVCLGVTCYLHFRQNDRDLLRVLAVTRGLNGYQNESRHRNFSRPLVSGPTLYHWAIHTPPIAISIMENPGYKVTTVATTFPKTYMDLGMLEARDNLEQTN